MCSFSDDSQRLRSALESGTDVAVVRGLCNGQPLPKDVRPVFWKVRIYRYHPHITRRSVCVYVLRIYVQYVCMPLHVCAYILYVCTYVDTVNLYYLYIIVCLHTVLMFAVIHTVNTYMYICMYIIMQICTYIRMYVCVHV